MKAVSLWEPWASAIPFGLKRIETRHWQTSHRGLIAIHAAKKVMDHDARQLAMKYRMQNFGYGHVIATANLLCILPSELLTICVSQTERDFGIYDPKRFGWILIDIRPLRRPIPYRGGQGIFNVPDELIRAAA